MRAAGGRSLGFSSCGGAGRTAFGRSLDVGSCGGGGAGRAVRRVALVAVALLGVLAGVAASLVVLVAVGNAGVVVGTAVLVSVADALLARVAAGVVRRDDAAGSACWYVRSAGSGAGLGWRGRREQG